MAESDFLFMIEARLKIEVLPDSNNFEVECSVVSHLASSTDKERAIFSLCQRAINLAVMQFSKELGMDTRVVAGEADAATQIIEQFQKDFREKGGF